ncbi:MAG: hypothetical protein ACUVSX_15535 [Aggregatilineales bacterium]
MTAGLRAHIGGFAFYLLAAVTITWPLATALDARLLGHPFGDAAEYTRHIWWIKRALQTGQPVAFQPDLGWPDGMSGAWLWAAPLQSFPAWQLAFVLPLPLAFNAQALLTLALNGWAMFALAQRLTGTAAAALLAGLIFMAYPAAQGQLAAAHIGLLALWPAPLYVYALERARDNRRWAIAAGALFAVSLWGSPLLLVYVTGPVTLLLALRAIRAHDQASLVNVVAAAALGGLLALPFLLPLLEETRAAPPWLPGEGGAVDFSADLFGLATPMFYHPLFAGLDYSRRVLGVDPFERVAYAGAIAVGLAAVGALRWRAARGWLLLALAAWALSLGPLLKVGGAPLLLDVGGGLRTHIVLPWALVGELPLLNLTRTPARFNLLIGLALAVMAGYGAAALWRPWMYRRGLAASAHLSPLASGAGFRARSVAFLTIGALILFEYQSFWPLPSRDATIPEAVAALRGRDYVRAVFDVPWEHPLAGKDGLYLQTAHYKPLIGGHVTRRTPVNPAKLAVLQGTLDPALLDAAQVDVIILHREWDGGRLEPLLRARLGAPVYADARLALFERTAPDAPPGFAAVYDAQAAFAQFYDIHFYAPAPGWVTLRGALWPDGRAVAARLDFSAPLHPLAAGDAQRELTAPFYVVAPGYHTLRLETGAPCPVALDPLACRTARLERLALDYVPAQAAPVTFARGVTLTAARAAAAPGGVDVWLNWTFAAPPADSDRRFVHVLDADGRLAAQDDAPAPRAEAWAEAQRFDLPPGVYRVYTGWYSLPDGTRFSVLDGVEGAADGLVYVGTVTVTAPA